MTHVSSSSYDIIISHVPHMTHVSSSYDTCVSTDTHHHQVRASLLLSPRRRCLALRPPRPSLSPGRRGACAQPLVRPHGEGQRGLLAQPAPCAPRPAAAAAPALARACLQGRRGQAAGHLRSRRVPCLTLAPGVEGAVRCYGCRVEVASCNGGDECVGKVLRVHARRHQPVLPVVEAQSTLCSLAPRPQLACLRHRQRVFTSAGNRAHLGTLKHLLRPHQRLARICPRLSPQICSTQTPFFHLCTIPRVYDTHQTLNAGVGVVPVSFEYARIRRRHCRLTHL